MFEIKSCLLLVVTVCLLVGIETDAATVTRGDRYKTHDSGSSKFRYATFVGKFSVDLYRQMAHGPDNFVISPLSVHSALSMLQMGTEGKTSTQLLNSLYARPSVHEGFRVYISGLSPKGRRGNTVLKLANALYTRRAIMMRSRYTTAVENYYNSEMSHFEEKEPEKAINTWVSKNTNGRIPSIMDDGEMADETAMLLLNAVYFKGFWKDAFFRLTSTPTIFTDDSGEQHQLDMMRREGLYHVSKSNHLGATVLKLPYKDERYSLNIILPGNDVTLETVEGKLTWDILDQIFAHLAAGSSHRRVNVMIPRFALDLNMTLNDVLRDLGIQEIFSNPNLRRMTSQRMNVTQVKQRCILEVDEAGTRAAGVKGTNSGSTISGRMVLSFIANKPFMFVLRDDATSVNLLMGRYKNPSGANVKSLRD